MEFSKNKDIIVFSHLRWNSVTQRPQHLIRGLSEGRKILFVEEPVRTEKQSKYFSETEKNIKVITPNNIEITNSNAYGEIVNKTKIKYEISEKPIIWFYSPAFISVLPYLDYSLIVYDCMDQLTAFLGAPPLLVDQEKVLLKNADVVFTGGKSLYEAKRKRNKNTYCFPSSVDYKHFSKALSSDITIPNDIKDFSKPIIGYYGVIDERMDYLLIAEMAAKRPEYNFVYIGPVVKVNENDLPKNKNIIYLGKKNYEELPNYLKFFDVCMMPFALNKSTKYISPTKTLEFMAAEKPIVSTPIYDVKRDYSEVVKIADDSDKFIESVDFYLNEPVSSKRGRIKMENDIVRNTSWKNTVKEMQKIIEKGLRTKKSMNEDMQQVDSLEKLNLSV